MNDDTDKPLNTVGDDALEARITAWVLGEASSFEAGELEKLCAADPALGLFERRLRVLHGLVAEDFKAGPDAEWKLSAARRDRITDLLGVEQQQAARTEGTSHPFGRRALLALAACLVLGFVSYSLIGGVGDKPALKESIELVDLSLPAPAAMESRARASLPSRPASPAMGFDGAKSEPLAAPVPELAGRADLTPPAEGMAESRESAASAPAVSEPLIAGNRSGDGAVTWSGIDGILNKAARTKELRKQLEEPSISDSKKQMAFRENQEVEREGVVKTEWSVETAPMDSDGSTFSRPGQADGPRASGGRGESTPSERALASTEKGLKPEADQDRNLAVPPAAPAPLAKPKGDAGAIGDASEDPVRSNPALAEDGAGVVDEVRSKLHLAEGNHDLGKFDDAQRSYEEVLRIDPNNEAARRGIEKVAGAKSDYDRAAYDKTRAALLTGEETVSPEEKQMALDLMSEVAAEDEPFSTFSLHVSDASFKLAHAAMERGEALAPESIRPEEFYNAFDYGDPAPANGEPVVCVTEQSAHPAFAQRNLLRIGVRTGSQGRGASTPLNLTLLLDHSGSMEREDRNAGLAMAVRQLSGLLKEGDTITVAGFSRQPRLLADRLPGARAQELNELIARTPSEGGTNLEEGLKLGEELAKRQFNPAAQNRVVLFTDGAANLGDARPEALQARIEGLRQQGIAFDAAGFGADGLNDKLLERLTRNGNGRYYIVDGPEDADAGFAKQLAGAFRPAAENVKVQVRFNPARVAKYKLIGFEEHRLQKEDFRNDAVDAAEMAAEEAGNALYQIETLPQGEGEVGEVSVRFRDVASGQMVERTWTIPYDAQAPAFDQATPSIQLAGLAAFTAEKLRAAPMADAVDFQQLGQVYAGVRARYPNSQPVADLGSMIGKMK